MREFELVCRGCGSEYKVDELEPGNMPGCPVCGGAFKVKGEVTLTCLHCLIETEPVADLPLDVALPCPKCGRTLSSGVPFQKAKDDTVVESLPSFSDTTRGIVKPMASDDTIPLAGAGDGVERTLKLEDATFPLDRSADSDVAVRSVRSGGIKAETFGRYRIIKEIARGGMGIVYKVYDPELRRELALKVLIEGEGAGEDTIKRFMREARAAGNLRHPNIITVHEMGQIDGQYYFTMEFVEGRSFQQINLLRGKERMRPKEFVRQMLQVCDALELAHDSGIVHRDLKPANILMDDVANKVVLMDFGLAKDNTSYSIQSMTGSVFGSPSYMSPEQAQGRTHEIDHRTDIYSMGVILYEGLTMRQPFSGETVYDTITQVVNCEPVPPRAIAPFSVDKDMENIILKCMEKDASKRYQTIQELKADLQSYLDGLPVSARPVPPHVRFWRKVRRKPLALGGLIGAPLALAAGVVGWLVFSGPSLVELAAQSIHSDDPQRQIGGLKELAAELREGKIATAEERFQALALFREGFGLKSQEAAIEAMRASGDFADPQSVPLLLSIAANTKDTAAARLGALDGLAAAGASGKVDNPKIAIGLVGVLRDAGSPEQVRLRAAAALRSFWNSAATPELLALAQDREAPTLVRVAALEPLKGRLSIENPRLIEVIALCGDGDERVEKAADAVVKAARTRDSVFDFYGFSKDVAVKAMEGAAGAAAQEADHQQALLDFMEDMDRPANAPKATTPLEAMLAKLVDKASAVRSQAAFDLGELGDGQAVPFLVKALGDADPAARNVAARAIVKLADKRRPNLQAVRGLLGDQDPMVREQAAILLGKLGDKDAIPELLAAAEREDSRRTISAMAKALERFGDSRALPVLAQMFTRCGENPAAAIACVDALASFGEPALPALVDALGAESLKVKGRVAERLAEITGENHGEDQAKWRQWLSAKPHSN